MSRSRALARWAIERPLAMSFGASGLIQALNVLTGILLARTLGPTDRGQLAVVLLWPSLLATIGSLGIAEAITFHIARRTAAPSIIVGATLVIASLQSCVLVVMGLVILPVVLKQYPVDTLRAAQLFLAYIPLNIFTLDAMGALNGLHRFTAFQTVRLVVILATVVGFGGLAAVGSLSLLPAVAVYLLANFGTMVASWSLLARAAPLAPRWNQAMAIQLVRYGLQSHVSNVSAALNDRLDQLVISLFIAPARLGLYVIALSFTAVSGLVSTSVGVVTLPQIAYLEGSARSETAARLLRVNLMTSVAATIPLLVFAPWLVSFLFGNAYAESAEVARVLLVAAVVMGTGRTLGATLKALGRPLDAGVAELAAIAVLGSGLAVLLPTLDIVGAAIASLAAYVVSAGWMAHRAAQALGIPVIALLVPDLRAYAKILRHARSPR